MALWQTEIAYKTNKRNKLIITMTQGTGEILHVVMDIGAVIPGHIPALRM